MTSEWTPPAEGVGTAGPSLGTPRALGTITELVQESWELLKRYPLPSVLGIGAGILVSSVGMGLVYFGVFAAVMASTLVGAGIGAALDMSEDAVGALIMVIAVPLSLLGYAVMLAVFVPAQVLMLRGGLATARGEEATLGTMAADMPRLTWRGMGLSLLIIAALLPSMLLLYIPAIYLGMRWSLAFYLLIDADMGVIDSMRTSWQLTEGRVLDLFVKYMVFGVGATVLGLVTCYMGFVIILPLQMVLTAVIYLRLSGQDTGVV